MVTEAFRTKNALLLWNFENDCLLNSQELDDLMEQDCRQYSNSQGNYSHDNNNRNNLINSLNTRHRPLPLPSISPRRKGKFLMNTGPPSDLLEMASANPDSTYIPLNYQSLPSLMDLPGPSQPFYFQEQSSNKNCSRSSNMMVYAGPPPQQYQGHSQQMMQPMNILPSMNTQMPPIYYFQPPANPENMVFPNSGQAVYGPPPPPSQVNQTSPPQMAAVNMPMQQQQCYPPPPPNQIPPNPDLVYYGPPPAPPMMPSQQALPSHPSQLGQMIPSQPIQQQEVPPMVRQMGQMIPSQPIQQQEVPPMVRQMGQIMPSQPIQQQQTSPMVSQMGRMYSAPTDQAYQQPLCQPYPVQNAPPPCGMNSDGYMVPCAPVPAEPVNFQPPGHFIDPNHPDIVYDTSGCAYQRVVVNTTCLVQIQQYAETAVPLEQETNDKATIQEVHEEGNVQEGVPKNPDKPDGSDTGIEDCESQTPVEPGNYEEEEGDIVDTDESDSTHVLKNDEDIDDDLVSSSIESESFRDTSASRSEIGEDIEQCERMDTPLAEVLNKCDISESEVEQVESNQYEAHSCTIVLPSPPMRVAISKTIVIEEVVDKGDAVHTSPVTSSSGRKQRLTKKQKRIQAAEKARKLETDDAILEEALKSKKEYLAANGLSETVETPAAPPKTANNKKKSREQMKVIIENVTLSNPAPQLINPRIMHRIKTAIHARAKSLEETGRPTSNPNIYRQKFLEAVVEFEKNFARKTMEDFQLIKDFIERRIAFFRTLSPALSFSRITIYEHLYVDTPKSLLIELHFLISLPTNTREQIVQLEEFEDTFLSLF